MFALIGLSHPSPAVASQAAVGHTNPLNLDPLVREAYQHFYILDYDGAISRFEQVLQQHPKDPMAYGYLEMALVFKELYHQDLLDTTYYAHDSFLTSKRVVQIPAASLQRIDALADNAISLADQQIKANPRDADAYFARGYARGIHAGFLTLALHSWVTAARQGYASKTDSDQVLAIDPKYADARMAIGIQQFSVASLPRFIRLMVGMVGVGGSRERGLAMLRESAAHGTITAVESRTVMSLFLRHDARYPEALEVERGLAQEFPHNYLYRLEEANLQKDEGNGPAAIVAYKHVLQDAAQPGYFVDPRLQLALFGLAETERGQNLVADAAQHYLQAAEQPMCSDWLRKRSQLNAGEMFDLLHDRKKAVWLYQMAAAGGGDQSQADAARRYLKTPYAGR